MSIPVGKTHLLHTFNPPIQMQIQKQGRIQDVLVGKIFEDEKDKFLHFIDTDNESVMVLKYDRFEIREKEMLFMIDGNPVSATPKSG